FRDKPFLSAPDSWKRRHHFIDSAGRHHGTKHRSITVCRPHFELLLSGLSEPFVHGDALQIEVVRRLVSGPHEVLECREDHLKRGQTLLTVDDVPRADMFSVDPPLACDDRPKEMRDVSLAPLNSKRFILDVVPQR